MEKEAIFATIVKAVVGIHLLFLLLQTSVVGQHFIPPFLLFANWFQLALIFTPILLYTFATKAKTADRDLNYTASLIVIYGLLVLLSSLRTPPAIEYFSQVILVPAGIYSLTVCAPKLMKSKDYHFVFCALTLVLVLHSLLTFAFMVLGTHKFLGQNVADGAGRTKYFFGMHFPHTDGLYANANAIGSFLMYFPGLLVAQLAFCRAGLSRWLCSTSLIIITAALALTFSRGPQLSVLLALAFPALALRKHAPVKSILSCFILALLAGIIISPALSPAQVENKSLSRFFTSSGGESHYREAHEPLVERGKIWREMLSETGQSWLGVGLMKKSYSGLSPHNFLLANYVYYGFCGLLSLILLLCFVAIKMVKRVRQYPRLLPLAGTLLAIAILHGQFEYVLTHPLYFSNSMFWLLVGFVCFAELEPSAAPYQMVASSSSPLELV